MLEFYFKFHSILIIVILIFPTVVKAYDKGEDYYTSLIGIQKLAQTEQGILKAMIDFKARLETRLKLVNWYLEDYEESVIPLLKQSELQRKTKKLIAASKMPIFEDSSDLQNLSEIISAHPLLAFRLLRRMSRELPELMINLSEDIKTEFTDFVNNFAMNMRIPNAEDINGAADGLLRIQDSYDIDICDFIKGKFNQRETNTGLKAFDLHYVGIRAFNVENHSRAVAWLHEAYKRTLQSDSTIAADVVAKHLELAITKHNDALAQYGQNIGHLVFNKPLSANLTELVIPQMNIKVKNNPIYYTEDRIEDIFNFQAVCRGEILQPPQMRKTVKCYLKQDTPSTMLSPLKIEVHNENPSILQIYNLLPDSIISKIKTVATPIFRRARILGTPENRDQKSDLRTSSVMWIHEYHHDLIKEVPRIISEMTGLNARSGDPAEELQISSYTAVGGHYNPHMDNLFDDMHVPHLSESDKFRGDRIATVMFYLSEVEEGGGTAFPRLGVATKAAKGSAVFWYNLKRNGEKDRLMLHGGCPVAYGNKWVANKWIRRNDQMFLRPCSLNKTE